MTHRPLLSVLAVVVLGLAACTPGPGAPQPSPQGPGSTVPKTLTMAIEGEPDTLGIRIGLSSNTIGNALQAAVHGRLATYDDRAQLHPQLAADLPAQEKGTWVVRPDGTMQTTYRLKRNVLWHDGTPLTSHDFILGWTVFRDPDLPVRPGVAQQITAINAPDDATLVLEWRRTYPFANAIVEDDLGPLPVHLLESVYRADKERFLQLGYWAREFVGVGPYQVAAWDAGTQLTLKAYDRWHGGRPKIDTIVVRFIQSSPTAVANLLAGAVDGVIGSTIEFNQAMFVKESWQREGKTPLVVSQPTHWRWMTTQFRVPNPTEIVDLRVRRGLLHAIDRRAMLESLYAGEAPVSESFLPTSDARWQWIEDVVVAHQYDTRRAQQLLEDAGWRRGPDGEIANAAGGKVTVPIWTTAGGTGEQEIAIIGDHWKALGLTVNQHILGRAESDDHLVRASFPGFETTSNPIQFRTWTTILAGRECPSEQTRWVGRNRGCYLNPESDRIIDGLERAIDPAEQRQLYRDFATLLAQDLPILPLYFPVRVTLFREGVSGVKGRAMPSGGETWNISEWDVR